MTATSTLIYDVQRIVDVQRLDGVVRITFHNGQIGQLSAEHPNFEILMIHVESELRERYPVGVFLDATGHVVDLCGAHETAVQSIKEDPEDRNSFLARFWGYSPVCCLSRDHPEFERIHATLVEAAGTQHRVWVATHSTERVEGPVDEEGFIPAYPKILDVRPVELPAEPSNGARP